MNPRWIKENKRGVNMVSCIKLIHSTSFGGSKCFAGYAWNIHEKTLREYLQRRDVGAIQMSITTISNAIFYLTMSKSSSRCKKWSFGSPNLESKDEKIGERRVGQPGLGLGDTTQKPNCSQIWSKASLLILKPKRSCACNRGHKGRLSDLTIGRPTHPEAQTTSDHLGCFSNAIRSS